MWLQLLLIFIFGSLFGEVQKGSLWSLISLNETPLGAWWGNNYKDFESRYPELRFTSPDELHITLIVIGNWEIDRIPDYEKYALIAPTEGLLTPLIPNRLGKYKQWITLDCKTIPESFRQQVIANKQTLIALKLKPKYPFDDDYIAHTSLATTKSTPHPPQLLTHTLTPTEEQALTNLLSELQQIPLSIDLTYKQLLARTALWLTGATRPADYPHYIPLNDWLLLSKKGLRFSARRAPAHLYQP